MSSKFILPLLINMFLGLVLYFVIEYYPEFICPTILIELIVYIGIVAIDRKKEIRKFEEEDFN